MKLNNMYPLVSVIVPVYGEEDYLPSCIDSICDQTYNNLEIILVDDGSPDGCPAICDSYAKKDNRIKVVHKKNAGLVEARKTGINNSTGSYIVYVDGDDLINKDHVKNLLTIALNEGVDVVVDGFYKSTNGKKKKYVNLFKTGRYDKEKLNNEVYPHMISSDGFYSFGIFTYVWNKLFKKSVLLNNQLSVPSQLIVGEDSSCVYPTLLQVDSIFITDKCGYCYRQRQGSLLRLKKNDVSMVARLKACYLYLNERFKEMGVMEVMQPQVTKYIISQLLMLSDCLVRTDNQLPRSFPFLSIDQHDKVILYSAGAFGMHLYSQFKEYSCCDVVSLCDPDNDFLGPHVTSLEEAIKNYYDKIVIASIDRSFINQAVMSAKSLGIPNEKIVTIDDSKDFVLDYCERYLNR